MCCGVFGRLENRNNKKFECISLVKKTGSYFSEESKLIQWGSILNQKGVNYNTLEVHIYYSVGQI
jgi:hypothetical protein